MLAAERRERVYRPQGRLAPVLLVDGRIAGVWAHERSGKRLEVTVEPFGRIGSDVEAAVSAEAQRLAAFLGGDLASLTLRNRAR